MDSQKLMRFMKWVLGPALIVLLISCTFEGSGISTTTLIPSATSTHTQVPPTPTLTHTSTPLHTPTISPLEMFVNLPYSINVTEETYNTSPFYSSLCLLPNGDSQRTMKSNRSIGIDGDGTIYAFPLENSIYKEIFNSGGYLLEVQTDPDLLWMEGHDIFRASRFVLELIQSGAKVIFPEIMDTGCERNFMLGRAIDWVDNWDKILSNYAYTVYRFRSIYISLGVWVPNDGSFTDMMKYVDDNAYNLNYIVIEATAEDPEAYMTRMLSLGYKKLKK
jgi:hypothetical protein